jgi:hypothetical protein
MRRRGGVLLLTGVAVAAVVVGANTLISRAEAEAEVPVSAEDAGWRWETYQDVQLKVPDSWGQSLWAGPPDCTEDDWLPEPVVLRPGGARFSSLKVCRTPKPAKQVAPSVVFTGERPGVVQLDGGWVRETRKIGDLLVTVTAGDDELRRSILDSASVIDSVDRYGCDPRSPLAKREVVRPSAQGGLKSVGAVNAVSVCRYSTQGLPVGSTGSARLQASSRLTGVTAERLVRDLLAAPRGAGPTVTDPRMCVDDPGSEVIVLGVDGSTHDQDVIYRYAGCKHNGTDDGTALRQLTSTTTKQIFVGVHQPHQIGNVLHQLLIGVPPPVR